MNRNYVTHKEFDDAMHNIDKNFSDLHLSLYKDMVGIALGAVTIISLLIALFAFMK